MEKTNEAVQVTVGNFSREPSRYQDIALTRPVIVTRNGRDRTVMISVDEYDRFKRRDREVFGIEDFTEEDIEGSRPLACGSTDVHPSCPLIIGQSDVFTMPCPHSCLDAHQPLCHS